MSPVDSGSTIIFLHIPKTAGSTLNTIIDRQYQLADVFTIDSMRVRESTAEFHALPEKRRASFKIVRGHMSFGLHEVLPGQSSYVTFLRDPVKRIISHYHYVLHHPSHYLHGLLREQNLSLHDYVQNGISPELNNGQTRLLAGVHEHDTVHGAEPCVPELLSRAKENLTSNFMIVGLAEKFDEALLLLRRRLGWTNTFYKRQNVASERPKQGVIDDNTLQAIRAANNLDLQLYEFAQQLLLKQLAQQDNLFRLELAIFKLLNRIYGTM